MIYPIAASAICGDIFAKAILVVILLYYIAIVKVLAKIITLEAFE